MQPARPQPSWNRRLFLPTELAGLWALLSLAGCTSVPDVFSSPRPGPAPVVQRDTRLSGEKPIPSRLLEGAGKSPGAHEVLLLEDGDDALLARIHLIRAARESIDIQTFIWVYDSTGTWIFQELLRAARRGVRVRLLVDQIVPPEISAEEYAAIVTAHQNLEVRLFRPLTEDAINTSWTFTQTTFTRYATLNRRMHNKVLLVDGEVAITGGRNYQDAYYDRDPDFNYIDRDILFTGPATAEAAKSFEVFWNARKAYEASRMHDLREVLEDGRARLPDSLTRPIDGLFREVDRLAGGYDITAGHPRLKTWRVDSVEFVWDSPAKLNPFGLGSDHNAFDPLIEAVQSARTEVCVQSPYVVMGKKGYKLFRKMRKANPGLHLHVITNSLASTDNVYAGAISLKQRRDLIEDLGFELYVSRPLPGDIRDLVSRYDQLLQQPDSGLHPEWPVDMEARRMDLERSGPIFSLHSKSLVVDQTVSFVGSHNFDPRSFSLNTECGVVIRDDAFSLHLDHLLEKMMEPENSWIVAAREYPPVMAELNSFITMITSQLPLFDIWPLEHTTCYELREGFEPVPPNDGQFYERYRDVGPLPGMDLDLTAVQAQLIRAFAGFAAPLM